MIYGKRSRGGEHGTVMTKKDVGDFMLEICGYTVSQTVSSSSKRSHSYYLALIITTSIIGATIAPAMFFFGLGQTTASDTSLLSNGETVFSIIFAILFFN